MDPIPHDVTALQLAERLRPVSGSSTDGVDVWLDQNGSDRLAEADTIPPTYGGHTFASHFVRKVG